MKSSGFVHLLQQKQNVTAADPQSKFLGKHIRIKGPVDVFMLAWVVDHLVQAVFRLLA